MDPRPVVVTGATGYVGGRLVPELLAALPVAVISLVIALRTPERALEEHQQVLAEPVV